MHYLLYPISILLHVEDYGRSARNSNRDNSVIPGAFAIALGIGQEPLTVVKPLLVRVCGRDCDKIARAPLAIVEHDFVLLD